MGLGGAIIALNRQNAVEEENRQRNIAQRAAVRRQRFYPLSAVANAIRDYFGSNDHPPANVEYEDYGDWLEPAWENHWDAEWLPEGARRLDAHGIPKVLVKLPAWLPSYTHPGEPGPGFSFDFDPKVVKEATPTVIVLDDDDSSGFSTSTLAGTSTSASSADVTPSLVCARCLDPLALSSQEGVLLSPEESRRRRVWALRCGHMLDGKCIDELMRPDILVAPVEEKPDIAHERDSTPQAVELTMSKGRGEARAMSATPTRDAKTVEVSSESKGKGKAVDQVPLDTGDEDDASVGALELLASSMPSADTSIRSRLRPRPSRSAISSTAAATSQVAEVAVAAAAPRAARPLPRRRGHTRATPSSVTTPARPKGKGRARKPVVEECHEWFCPVSGCCREHISVRMRDEQEWKMDESRGAIALFI